MRRCECNAAIVVLGKMIKPVEMLGYGDQGPEQASLTLAKIGITITSVVSQ
jgi:hypothetical protein